MAVVAMGPDPVADDEMRPAVRMREYLVRCRRDGRPFDVVWQFALSQAVRGLPPATAGARHMERTTWLNIFGDTRDVWQAAYERREHPALDLLDRIRSDP